MRATPAERLAASLAGEIGDERVVAALAAVPREAFVPPGWREHAYEDRPLPIGLEQTISQPFVVARMCALLEVGPADRVLDVGTGSGYHAAVLARLAREVVGIECHPELAERARAALEETGARNVTVLVGDGTLGVPERAPFDAINVAAAAREADLERLEGQLAPGGRLVAPLRSRGGAQRLVRSRRSADGARLTRERLDPVRFVPLVPGG